jgi:hypothetical protein
MISKKREEVQRERERTSGRYNQRYDVKMR